MKPKITRKDVFLYFAGQLSDDQRRAVEEACETSPEVRMWYNNLARTEDRSVRTPKIDLTNPRMARLAAIAFGIVRQDEEFAAWQAWASKPSPTLPGSDPEPDRLLVAPGGMVYRNEVPTGMSFDSRSPKSLPVTCPCVESDYARRYLIVCQPLDTLPDGRVDITAVRLRPDGETVTYRLESWQLEQADTCWYDYIPLMSVLSDGWTAGDTFVYVVQPSAATDRAINVES
jgi:hypothetical protein